MAEYWNPGLWMRRVNPLPGIEVFSISMRAWIEEGSRGSNAALFYSYILMTRPLYNNNLALQIRKVNHAGIEISTGKVINTLLIFWVSMLKSCHQMPGCPPHSGI
jgi:hypothetical protein